MIPYEDLCRALDRFNGIRRNEAEMAQMEDLVEDNTGKVLPLRPGYSEEITDPGLLKAEDSLDAQVDDTDGDPFSEGVTGEQRVKDPRARQTPSRRDSTEEFDIDDLDVVDEEPPTR